MTNKMIGNIFVIGIGGILVLMEILSDGILIPNPKNPEKRIVNRKAGFKVWAWGVISMHSLSE